MKKTERKIKILDILRKENGLPIQILANQLEVSHMTVRRDVEELAEEKKVRLIHGGVILSPSLSYDRGENPYTLHEAGEKLSEIKDRIARRAASIIEPGETLAIDSGSTTEYLARNLPENMELNVICYALNIITQVAGMDQVKSIFAGGMLHKNLLMFESPEGLSLIRRYRATTAFISAAGVSLDLGVTCMNDYERETKIAVIESSVRKVLLADSSKFGVVRSEYFAEVDSFDAIVTDSGLNDEIKSALESRGIEVIVA
jgi:DeoR family deoxyribose operon repressor